MQKIAFLTVCHLAIGAMVMAQGVPPMPPGTPPEASAQAAAPTPAPLPMTAPVAQPPAAPAAEPAVAAVPAPAATATPKITCVEATFNFGEKSNTETVEHNFTIRNTGDANLEIRNVRASCGCTAAQPSANLVPPGEEVSINVKLNLTGRQGPQHKTITVESNDPSTPSFVLNLQGTAVNEMSINPTQLFYGRLQPGAAMTNVVEVSSARAGPFHIKNSRSDVPQLGFNIETVEEGLKYRVMVWTIPPLPEGRFSGMIILETDHARYPTMTIPVMAYVAP